jgi:hypothetical protein
MSVDRNSLAYWFPPLEAAGLPVPRTEIVRYDGGDLLDMLDGMEPFGWDDLVARIRGAGDRIGWPVFLRTGHGSGKHEWARCCYLADPDDLGEHVFALVEWSHLVDMFGLPTNVWADGDVEHIQPYWPPDAVELGGPDDPGWRAKLAGASRLSAATGDHLAAVARAAVAALGGGFWSVDLLEDRDGDWWLTDMAEGERSFRWEP